MKKKVVVTGASGFIGRYIVNEFAKFGYSVYAISRNTENLAALNKNENVFWVNTSIESLELENLPIKQCDLFIHIAWSGVNRIDIDNLDIHKHNYDNSVKCLNLARKLNCSCFIDSGSKAEYGVQSGIHHEKLECIPINAYGRQKLKFYDYASNIQTNDMKYIHTRLFSVIGIYDHSWSLVNSACSKMLNNEEMNFGSCQQLWNFIAVEDVARAFRKIFESSECNKTYFPIYNIASFDTRILRSFIEEIYIVTKSHSKLFFHDEKQESKGNYMNPSINRLVDFTGWKPEISFEYQIKKIIKDMKKQNGDSLV